LVAIAVFHLIPLLPRRSCTSLVTINQSTINNVHSPAVPSTAVSYKKEILIDSGTPVAVFQTAIKPACGVTSNIKRITIYLIYLFT
jgi:hypothetical protein